jgi:hypothetical protein
MFVLAESLKHALMAHGYNFFSRIAQIEAIEAHALMAPRFSSVFLVMLLLIILQPLSSNLLILILILTTGISLLKLNSIPHANTTIE